QDPGQLQTALINNQALPGRAPVPARIMAPALVPAEFADRQPRDHLVRGQAIQGRVHHGAAAGPVGHPDATGTPPGVKGHPAIMSPQNATNRAPRRPASHRNVRMDKSRTSFLRIGRPRREPTVRFSFLILIGPFATLEAWSVEAPHPCTMR